VRTLLCLAIVAAIASPAPRPSLRDLLRAAGAYSEHYHEAFTTIVAEERYVQRQIHNQTAPAAEAERTLRSDVMLIRGAAGENAWFFFRDVFELDGRPVSDTRGRLESWFRESREGFMHKARALALEQARFNLGDIVRTINVPFVALEFLLPRHQDRFRFRLSKVAAAQGAETAEITYEERRRPTMIRTPEGDDVEARGTFWIDPATGRVLMSELRTGERNRRQVRAVITVGYAPNERLQMLVPVEMDESYEFGSVRIDGAAKYSNFRRFETDARIIRQPIASELTRR
jgi:hypothetical protein